MSRTIRNNPKASEEDYTDRNSPKSLSRKPKGAKKRTFKQLIEDIQEDDDISPFM